MSRSDAHTRGLITRFLREHVAPWWGLQIEIGLCLLLGVVLELADPLILKVIIDRAIGDGDRGLLFGLGAVLVVVLVFRVAFRLLSVALYSYGGLRILFELRQRLFEHVQRLPPAFLRGERMGDVLSRLTADVDILQRTAAHTVVNAFHDILLIVGILTALLLLDLKLALIFLVVYPLLALLLVGLNRRVRSVSMATREAIGGLYEFLEERLGAIRLIQEFRRERTSARDHVRVARPWIATHLKLSVLSAGQVSLADVMSACGLLLVFLVGGTRTMEGEITLGTLIAFYTLATRLFRPVSGLVDVNVDLQVARASLVRVYELLDREPEIRDAPDARVPESVRGEIEVRGATFAWPGAAPTLTDISLRVPAGAVVALVGPSGSGKSTLASLLVREIDPTAGTVLLDDLALPAWRLSALRRHVGLVPQETSLFHDTLRANLRLAAPHARDDDLRAALVSAGLGEWLAAQPQGLDTPLGRAGMRLSGGERQRVALARAQLKNPTVLVLDEATSAVDARTERIVLDNLLAAGGKRTLVLIAHRLASLAAVDRIFVLEKGRLVEEGTHAALIDRGGLYRSLYEEQQREEQQREGSRRPGKTTRSSELGSEPDLP